MPNKLTDIRTEIITLLGTVTTLSKVYDKEPRTISVFPSCVIFYAGYDNNIEEAASDSLTHNWSLIIYLDAKQKDLDALLQKYIDIQNEIMQKIRLNRNLNGKSLLFWTPSGGNITDRDMEIAIFEMRLSTKIIEM